MIVTLAMIEKAAMEHADINVVLHFEVMLPHGYIKHIFIYQDIYIFICGIILYLVSEKKQWWKTAV